MSLALLEPPIMIDPEPSSRATVAETLADRFSAGDENALAEIYAEHGRLVYSFCRRTLGPERAEDVTQDVFFAAWKSRGRYNPASGSIAGWLMGIARFKVIDLYRVEARNPLASEAAQDHEQGTESPGVENTALRMLLADALETLPERSRQMVEHAFLHDLTQSQIAERFDLPLGTVKSDIRRGLERLRRHMEGFDDSVRL